MSNLSYDFGDRTVIVTGAARGIGLALAHFFHEARGAVYMVDFDETALADAADEVGARAVQADVSKTADVERAVATAVDETGRVDVLVNNAGILRDGVVWKLTDGDWDDVLAVHAGGTFRFTRACVPHFRERGYGRIVNVTSYTGLHGNPGQANYGAAKAGIVGFTKTAAKELARFGVTVNAISPSAETRMVRSMPEDKREAFARIIPLGRFGRLEEMCAVVGFLAAEEASYVTGAIVEADGGLSM